MSEEIVPAHLAVQAMRDNGYKNAAYAIAELMDNSIQARATVVELLCAERTSIIELRQRSRIHQIAVLDNGCGMDAHVLKVALQFGNGMHLVPAEQQGMGKFGMGLPSASISQCTRVEVWSWQDGPDSSLYTYLDVNEIRTKKQTAIPDPRHVEIPNLWRQVGATFEKSGTLVVWSDLDRIMWRTARAIIENSEFLIGRMYRRFLDNKQVRIRMLAFDADNPSFQQSEADALPNDPGYLMKHTSCPPPFHDIAMFNPWPSDEYYEISHTVSFRGQEHIVKTRFSLAKKEAREGQNPGSQPHGKHAAKNTGVSIVRAARELDLDQSWIIHYDPVERWWGIEVEFPPALDELFGVTNNKQAARNFAELSELSQLETSAAAIAEMREDEDPRAPLLEIAQRIRTNLSQMRTWLRQQTKGVRTKEQRHAPTSPEAIATNATRERQHEGYKGESDKDENLSPQQREADIERTLLDEGVPEEAAKQMAATTVGDGLKYLFAQADLEMPAFFTVKPRGGAIVIILNTNHPAYQHLVEVLEREEDTIDADKLQERLNLASDGLKLLLSAWARYEDEQPDGQPRRRAQDARSDWGKMARMFLERED